MKGTQFVNGYTKATGVITFVSNSASNGWDVFTSCRDPDSQGRKLSSTDCGNAIINAATCLAASIAPKTTGFQDIGRREATEMADMVLANIQNSVKVTDIKFNGQRAGPGSCIRREDTKCEDPIDVFYNGTLPFTFILHHDMGITSNSSTGKLPLFVATNGSHHSVHHIIPIYKSSVPRRDGVVPIDTGASHISAGGLKIETGPDSPLTTYNDFQNWSNLANGGPGSAFVRAAKISPFVGFSLDYWVQGLDGNRASGQFVFRSKTVGFGHDFEPWNFCFGIDPSNCLNNQGLGTPTTDVT